MATPIPPTPSAGEGRTGVPGRPPARPPSPLEERLDLLGGRLDAVEAALAALGVRIGPPGATSGEVRTRRLVVTDDHERPRLVAEVVGGTVELRLLGGPAGEVRPGEGRAAGREVAPGEGAGPGEGTAAVVLHAGADRPVTTGGLGLGPAVGVQLWADGDQVAALDAWPRDDGAWCARPHFDPTT